MKTTIVETIVEVFEYTCETCGRTSTNKFNIEECELNHSMNKSIHPWWKQTDNVECTPAFYRDAMLLLLESNNNVSVFLSDELGDPVYVITPEVDETFWLGTFLYEDTALRLCKELGWCATVK